MPCLDAQSTEMKIFHCYGSAWLELAGPTEMLQHGGATCPDLPNIVKQANYHFGFGDLEKIETDRQTGAVKTVSFDDQDLLLEVKLLR